MSSVCSLLERESESESDSDSLYSFPSIFGVSSTESTTVEELFLGFSNDTSVYEHLTTMSTSSENLEKKRKRIQSQQSQSEDSIENLDTVNNANGSSLSDQIELAVRHAVCSTSIITALKEALFPAIENTIKQYLDEKVEPVKTNLEDLKVKVNKQEEMLNSFEKERAKTAIQQDLITTGRHNNLVITGLEEKTEENLNQVINDLAVKLDVRFISTYTADRIGRKQENKNRSILIRFASHWDKRKLYFLRTKLSSKGMIAVFINEDLAKDQSEIFFYARRAKQEKLIKTTWSLNGTVFIKKLDGKDIFIVSKDDLVKSLPGFDLSKYNTQTRK